MHWTVLVLSPLVLLATTACVAGFTEICTNLLLSSDTCYYKKEGEDVKFRCRIPATSPVKERHNFIWLLNGKQQNIPPKTSFQVRNRTEVMLVPTLTSTDFGNYTCVYPITDTAVTSYLLKLLEPVLIEDGKYTNEISAAEGSTVKLWCNATSVPPPEIEWYFSTQHGPLKTGIKGPMLGVREIDRTCPTRYICEALNPREPEAPVTKTISVTVLYAPELRLKISSRPVGEFDFEDLNLEDTDNKTLVINTDTTSDLKMKCVVSASPRNETKWIVNDVTAATFIGDEIFPNTSHSLRDKLKFSKNEVETFQIIAEVYKGTALGKYVCQSSNYYGTAKKTIHLKSKT